MAALSNLEVRGLRQWQAWLRVHHDSSDGVWLVFRKDKYAVRSLAYEEAVRAALCFGWIDSLVKRLDEGRYLRRFTPRRAGSRWSKINRTRWSELKSEGLLAPAGLAAAPTDVGYPARTTVPLMPRYIIEALARDARAWAFFQELAPSYRRDFVVWIHLAKRKETRDRRIKESIALLSARKKLGLR